MLAPNWNDGVAPLFVAPKMLLAGVEADGVLVLWPKVNGALLCGVGAAPKSPPVEAELGASLVLSPNKLVEAGAVESLFAAAPKVKGADAGAAAGVFDAPKAGCCDDCAPNVKPPLVGVEPPKAGELLPKFMSGCALNCVMAPLELLLFEPKLEGGKEDVVVAANGFDAGCAGGKLAVELLPKPNMPPLGVSCCCDCPNVKPPEAFWGAGADCAKGFEAAPALGSGPKLNALADGGLGLKAERPCAQVSCDIDGCAVRRLHGRAHPRSNRPVSVRHGRLR